MWKQLPNNYLVINYLISLHIKLIRQIKKNSHVLFFHHLLHHSKWGIRPQVLHHCSKRWTPSLTVNPVLLDLEIDQQGSRQIRLQNVLDRKRIHHAVVPIYGDIPIRRGPLSVTCIGNGISQQMEGVYYYAQQARICLAVPV